MTSLIEQAKAAAAKLADQTDESGGSFEYEPPAAGPCIGRFITYVEIGKMKQRPFKGAEKQPTDECIIEFQLLGKKHAKEIEVEGEDGKKTKKIIYPIMRLGRGPSAQDGKAVGNGMSMPGGSRSNHFKLLKAMDYGRGNTHMAFMLGEAFKLNVVHNEVEQEVNGKKSKVTYANLRDDNGVWQISAPMIQKFDEETGDPIGDPQPIKAPEATVEPRMLLWDAPSIEQWESLYIPGTITRKEGDKEVEVSRNWLQATALNAVNFEGSGLQALLSETGGDLPEIPDDLDPDNHDAQDEVVDSGADVPEDDEDATSGSENGADDDPFADLGL